jgi:excisionase family DNA binding protein
MPDGTSYARSVIDQLMTAEDVAARLKVDVSWVYRNKRALGAVRLGARMWRFPEHHLQAYLAEQERQVPAPSGPTRRPTPRPQGRRPALPAEGRWQVS